MISEHVPGGTIPLRVTWNLDCVFWGVEMLFLLIKTMGACDSTNVLVKATPTAKGAPITRNAKVKRGSFLTVGHNVGAPGSSQRTADL